MKNLKKILLPLLCTIVVGCSESGYAPVVNPAVTPAFTPVPATATNANNTSYAPTNNGNTQTLADSIANGNGTGTNGTNGCGCGCGCSGQQVVNQQLIAQPVVINPYLYAYRYQTNPNFYVWNYQSGNCVPSHPVVVSPCGTMNTGCSACANSGCSACANSGCSACAAAANTTCSSCSACTTCKKKRKVYTYPKPGCGSCSTTGDTTNTFEGDDADADSETTATATKAAAGLQISILNKDARILYERLAITPNDQESTGATILAGANYMCFVEGSGNLDTQYTCDEKGLASLILSRLPGTGGTRIGDNIKCYPLTNGQNECMMRFQVDTGTAEALSN
jgi:hypothetical protein